MADKRSKPDLREIKMAKRRTEVFRRHGVTLRDNSVTSSTGVVTVTVSTAAVGPMHGGRSFSNRRGALKAAHRYCRDQEDAIAAIEREKRQAKYAEWRDMEARRDYTLEAA